MTSSPVGSDPSTTDVSTSTLSSAGETPVSFLRVDWKAPPEFVAPGQEVILVFSLPTIPASGDMSAQAAAAENVTLILSGLYAPILASAVFDEVSSLWTATVMIPDTADVDELAVAVSSESGSSEPLSIPLVTDGS